MVLRHTRAACLVGLSIALFAADVRADETGSEASADAALRLAYEAPSECVDALGVRARVLSLVRTPPEKWRSPVEVRIRIELRDHLYVGRLGVVQLDPLDHPAAERELRATACLSVVDALTVSAAIAVDDALAEAERAAITSSSSPPGEEPVAAPAPEPSTPAPASASAHAKISVRPPPVRLSKASRIGPMELRVGDSIALRRGIVPEPVWMQSAWFSAARRNSWYPMLRAELAYGASGIARTDVGAYRARLLEGGLAACTPLRDGVLSILAVCAGVNGGTLMSSSFEVIRSADRVRPWFAAFAAPRIALPLLEGIAFVVEGRIGVPFMRERLRFHPGVTVYEAPPAVAQVGVGLEVTLPPLRP